MTSQATRVQICKHVTKDRVLDIADALSIDSRRSKLVLTLLEFDENYKAKTRVRHFVDVPDFKLVCWDILNRSFDEWTDAGGISVNGEMQAHVLSMGRDIKYRMPYVLKMTNGIGEQVGASVKMIRATDSLTLLLSEFDVRRLAMTVLDYLRAWETVNFRKIQDAQTSVTPAEGEAAE